MGFWPSQLSVYPKYKVFKERYNLKNNSKKNKDNTKRLSKEIAFKSIFK